MRFLLRTFVAPPGGHRSHQAGDWQAAVSCLSAMPVVPP